MTHARRFAAPRSRSARRAFTLVEMIVATLLLVIGVVAALTAFAGATAATGMAERLHTAALLGQQKLTEIELQPDSLASGDQSGDFSEQNPGYRWRQSVEPTDYPNLFKVTVTVQWGQANTPHERALTTYLRNDANAASSTSQTDPTGQAQNGAGTGGANANGAGNGGG